MSNPLCRETARAPWAHAAAFVAVLCALALAGSSPSGASPLFAAPFLSFETSPYPWSVAVGDLNGDGKVDLAVACYPLSTVSILLGDGDGLFHKGVDFTTGNGPYSIAMGDLDGDGHEDLVVGGSTVSVYLGQGDGTFAATADYPCAGRCLSVSIVDSNQDGKLDVVVFVDPQTASVFPGRGDGTLGSRSDYPASDYASSAAIGDVNGDGHPDLVIDGRPITVRLGQGDGTFGPPYECAGEGTGVAIADLNGDGRPDIATLGSRQVGVFPGNGDGSFGSEVLYGAAFFPEELASLAIADVNGDGRPDVVASIWGSGSDDPGAISVLCGNSAGGFEPDVQYPTASTPRSPVVVDLNGDGWPDVTCANTRNNAVSVMLNNGYGTFGGRAASRASCESPVLAMGDLNGDGDIDMVTAGYGSWNGPYAVIAAYLGDGAGAFERTTYLGLDAAVSSVALADINADGTCDIVFGTEYGTVGVLLGLGSGAFGPLVTHSVGTGRSAVAIDDLNGDGKPDLAVTCDGSNKVAILLGHGDGTFATQSDFPTGAAPSSVSIADFNGDGKPDVVVANYVAGTVSVLLGNGTGGLGTSADFAAGGNPSKIAVGDVNSDGKVDIAVTNEQSLGMLDGTVSVLLGNGDGSLGSSTAWTVGTFPTSVALGDLDGDGRPDLAVTNRYSFSVSVLLGKGDGDFADKTDFGTGKWPGVVLIRDLNGDGRPDLAVVNPGEATISQLLNHPAPALAVEPRPIGSHLLSLRAWPNPATTAERISFTLAAAGHVHLRVFDILGRSVATVIQDEMSAGTHEVVWRGGGDGRARVAPGVYLVVLHAGTQRAVTRFAVVH